jgi:hypothetical protein
VVAVAASDPKEFFNVVFDPFNYAFGQDHLLVRVMIVKHAFIVAFVVEADGDTGAILLVNCLKLHGLLLACIFVVFIRESS